MQPLPPQYTHATNKSIDHWTDESIWGHRFHNEQTPWLVLLEFMAVFRSRAQSGCALQEPREEGAHEAVQYEIPRHKHLRYLIFNNPYMQHIEETVTRDADRWKAWRKTVKDAPFDESFDYLHDRFREFSRFARVVEYFQNTALEPERGRRWTSKFIFPHGPDCIYADVGTNPQSGIGGMDRLFFARAGELLYLMLNRSSRGAELARAINSKLQRSDDRWNRLARALQPDGIPPCPDPVSTTAGYLPYAARDEYEEIARDWLGLLNTNMPGAAILDPLMRMTGLHLIRYILRRAQEEIGERPEPRLVLEIAAPKKTLLFGLSKESYDANRSLSRRALENNLERTRMTPEWQRACQAPEPALAAFHYLQEVYNWREKQLPGGDPDAIFDTLCASAIRKHADHMGKVVPDWSRHIGLATARRGVGTWYSPDDAFLKALVMTTVVDREEYHRFLSRLYDHYGLVIGVSEAERAYGRLPTDERVFIENAARLEQRLRTLGLLHRLSDDCAYVTNPFRASAQ